MSNRSFRLAGYGAILSALIVPVFVIASLLFGIEAWFDFFVVLAPAVLMPALAVVEPLHEPRFSRWSPFVTRVGLMGLVAFAAVAVLMPSQWWHADVHVHVSYFGYLMVIVLVMGLVLVLSNLTSLMAGTLPAAMALLGIAAGAAWTILLGMDLLEFFGSASSGEASLLLVNVLAPTWLLSHIVYTLWLGVWLIKRGGRRETVTAAVG